MTDRRQPSWKQGFARYASQSVVPNLRKGLVLAWSPELGPTGNTLRDVSGYQRHDGTLTNIPATDWLISEGAYSIKVSDDGDHILVPNPGFSFPGELTFLQWINPDDWQWFASFNWGAQWKLRITATATQDDLKITTLVNWTGASFTVPGVMASGEWQSVAVTRDSAGVWRAYRNGVLLSGSATNAGTFSPDLDMKIGESANTIRGKYGAVYWYNRKLADWEIRQLYEIGRGGIFRRKPMVIAKAAAAGLPIPVAMAQYRKLRTPV